MQPIVHFLVAALLMPVTWTHGNAVSHTMSRKLCRRQYPTLQSLPWSLSKYRSNMDWIRPGAGAGERHCFSFRLYYYCIFLLYIF